MKLNNQSLLITGIGGFIGLRTAELALLRGMQVYGLQHSQPKAEKARRLGANVILGSVTDPVAAQAACQGMDMVLHTAAIAKEGGALQDFWEVNVRGTVTMAQAAKAAGVRVFVHLSSVMVYGFNYPEQITEAGELRSEGNPYCQTKIEAEQALWQLHDPPNFNVIVIRAGDVYGPGSMPWTVRPLALMQQGLFFLPDRGQGFINHLYIDNLVDAIFLSLEQETSGEVFNITDGQQTSWNVFFNKLAAVAHLSPPQSLPASFLRNLIRLRCLSQQALGKVPDLRPESIDFITRAHTYSTAKAQYQIGFQPRINLDIGMQHIQAWLCQTDLRKPQWE